jgi:FMN phosphatase YigB (HAD superfamily)
LHNGKKYKCVVFDYYGTLYNPLKDTFGAKDDLFYDHMPELIKFVSSRASCAIATRSPLLIIKEQLSEAGLREFFSCVKSTEFGHDKPDPTILEHIMLELDVMASDCVMIGDSISDLAFAKNAGVDCIFVNFSDYKIDESFDAEVKSYTQAPIFNDVKLLQDYLDRRL